MNRLVFAVKMKQITTLRINSFHLTIYKMSAAKKWMLFSKVTRFLVENQLPKSSVFTLLGTVYGLFHF